METKWKRGGEKKEIKQDVMDYVFIKDSHFEHIHSHQCDSCWSQSAKACPPAKIKVKKKNKKNKHAICFTHVVTLLTILFLWWLFFFISCLFVCCFFSLLHNSLKKESGCRDVSVRLSHQGGGGGGGGWGWMGASHSHMQYCINWCHFTGGGGCSVTLAPFSLVSLTV